MVPQLLLRPITDFFRGLFFVAHSKYFQENAVSAEFGPRNQELAITVDTPLECILPATYHRGRAGGTLRKDFPAAISLC